MGFGFADWVQGHREGERIRMKSTAIVLAGGSGSRMNSGVAKQYLELKGRPVIFYSLNVFEHCPFIDEIVLVTRAEDIDFCRTEIVGKYDFRKVKKIVAGGKERFQSVCQGLLASAPCDTVYIHDGARPFVTGEILERARADVGACGACAVGMPVKDTIKISDEEGFCADTPDRSRIWQIQTPQAFDFDLICRAHERLNERLRAGEEFSVTDDAMVVEKMTDVKVKLTLGDYRNIKITTPEDLALAELFAGGLQIL